MFFSKVRDEEKKKIPDSRTAAKQNKKKKHL